MILALALLLQSAVQPGDWAEVNHVRGHFGGCPCYKVRMYADGRVVWHGVQFVEVLGDAEARVSPADARALIEEYRAKGFWDLKAEYLGKKDLSTTYTTVHIGADEKSVADHGSAPEWLKEMNRKLNELADTHRWWHGDAREERFAKGPDAYDNIYQDAYLPKPGVTALMKAAGVRKLEEVAALLSSGADVNARDPSGWTALMYAAANQYGGQSAEIVSALLRAGADPRARSDSGQTVLMAVSAVKDSEPVRMLVAAGADLNAQDDQGETALIDAVHRMNLNKIQALVDAGARTDIRDHTGHTAVEELPTPQLQHLFTKAQ